MLVNVNSHIIPTQDSKKSNIISTSIISELGLFFITEDNKYIIKE